MGVVDTGSLTDGLQNLHSAEEVRGALEAVLLPRVGAEDATAIARTLVVCNDVSSATPAYRTCKSLRPVSRASCIGGGGAGTTDS